MKRTSNRASNSFLTRIIILCRAKVNGNQHFETPKNENQLHIERYNSKGKTKIDQGFYIT